MSEIRIDKTEPSLGDMLVDLWRGKYFVIFGLVIAGFFAALFLFLAVPHYRASIIIAPASPLESMNADGDDTSRDNSGRHDALFTRFETMHKGASVAALLMREEAIQEGLNSEKAFTHLDGFFDAEAPDNAAELAEYISRRVLVDPVGETNLRQLYYYHPDPEFAALFLHRIQVVTDGLIRYSMRRDINDRIEYLQGSLGKVMHPDHRRALTDLLMEQERFKMLVSIDQPYAASVVEPASVSSKILWPDRFLIVSVFMFSGAFLGFVIYSAVRYFSDPQDALDIEFEISDTPLERWISQDAENNNQPKRRPLSGRRKKNAPKDLDDISTSDAAE